MYPADFPVSVNCAIVFDTFLKSGFGQLVHLVDRTRIWSAVPESGRRAVCALMWRQLVIGRLKGGEGVGLGEGRNDSAKRTHLISLRDQSELCYPSIDSDFSRYLFTGRASAR